MIKIEISEDYDPLPSYSFEKINHCVKSIFIDHKIQSGNVHFIIVTDNFLRKLKYQYFELDVFTDVITFNLEDEGEDIDGEIYISWDRILENAEYHSKNPQEEFKRILIHGVLHLIGYDDQTDDDKSQMTKLEDLYIAKFPEEFYS